VTFMAEHAHFFSLLEVEGRNFTDVLRRGTEQHIADTLALIRAGQERARSGTRTPACWRSAWWARSATTRTSTARAAGPRPPDELAAFVGRFVVHSVAADTAAPRRRWPPRQLPARGVQVR
jgi:hypothetical protein